MKHVLLATTALAMTAGVASAEFSYSITGKAGAGIATSTTAAVAAVAGIQPTTLQSTAGATVVDSVIVPGAATAMVVGETESTAAQKLTAQSNVVQATADVADATTALELHDALAALADAEANLAVILGSAGSDAVTTSTAVSGIDIDFSATITTDSGITITAKDDWGGGRLIDWNDDKAIDTMGVDMGQPAVTIGMMAGNLNITIDPNEVSDLYDDSQTGDVQISAKLGDFSIDYVAAQDTDENTNSYKLGYSMNDVLSVSVIGTSRGDAACATCDEGFQAAENDAMKWSATYEMGDLTLGVAMNNNGDNDDVTTGSVTYAMGNGLSVSLSADDNDDWDASATWTSGLMSVTYKTDESSDWTAYGSYGLGGGAKVFASTGAANDWSAFGVEFTF